MTQLYHRAVSRCAKCSQVLAYVRVNYNPEFIQRSRKASNALYALADGKMIYIGPVWVTSIVISLSVCSLASVSMSYLYIIKKTKTGYSFSSL